VAVPGAVATGASQIDVGIAGGVGTVVAGYSNTGNLLVAAIATPGAGLVVAVGTAEANTGAVAASMATVTGEGADALGRLDHAGDYIDGEFRVLETNYANLEATPQAELDSDLLAIRDQITPVGDELAIGGECSPFLVHICLAHWSVADELEQLDVEAVALGGEMAALGTAQWAQNLIDLIQALQDLVQGTVLQDQASQFHSDLQGISASVDRLNNTVSTLPYSMTVVMSSTITTLFVPQDLPGDFQPARDALVARLPASHIPDAGSLVPIPDHCNNPTVGRTALPICTGALGAMAPGIKALFTFFLLLSMLYTAQREWERVFMRGGG